MPITLPPALAGDVVEGLIKGTAWVWGQRAMRRRERKATELIIALILEAESTEDESDDRMRYVMLEARRRSKAARKLRPGKLRAVIEQTHSALEDYELIS